MTVTPSPGYRHLRFSALGVFGLALAVFGAAAIPAAAQVAPAAAQVVTHLTDPPGDDHGPGSYTYPAALEFVPGAFDILSFVVTDLGDSVRFEVGIAGEITNPWNSDDGYSLQSLDIYIDQDGVSGSGATWTPDGRNATVNSRDAWEKLIWVAPRFGGEFAPGVHEPSGLATTTGVEVALDLPGRVISVTVPESLVGEPQPGWNYLVAMLGQDGFNVGRIRPVYMWGGQYNFSGGTDGSYDSNIIDLVTSDGVSQEGMLSRYSEYEETAPVLYATDNGVPPQISHGPVTTGEAHRPLIIAPRITDEVVAEAWVVYGVNGGEAQRLDLWRDLDQFSVRLPGSEMLEGVVEYVIFASDGFDTVSAPADTTRPHVVAIGPDVTPPVPRFVNVYPEVISPDGDEVADELIFYVDFPEPVTVDARVLDARQAVVRTLATGDTWEGGWAYYYWNGRDDQGLVVPDGTYRLEMDAVDLAGRTATAVDSAIVEVDPGDRQLEVILFFHYNQSLVPYSRIGNISCYYGLTEVLRRHPESHFPLHLSGTLLHSLMWFDPETVELVREGVDAGQFEIVGSTYAQNIMYSTRSDDDDFQQNEAQIRVHRELLEEIFGVSPVTFWNCERVWTQNFVELLTRTGYRIVQVEDYLTERAGRTGSEYLVRTTSYEGDTLVVFNDDKAMIGTFDYTVETGDTPALLSFLQGIWTSDAEDRFAVAYFQDAEATGLWDYEGGGDPQSDWAHLDALLTAIEADPRYRLVTFEEWVDDNQPAEHLPFIPDGAADWMGRDAWFTLNSGSTAETYRRLFDTVRDSLTAVGDLIAAAPGSADTAAAAALLDHAWLTFVAHQFEFAVTGYEGLGAQFEMIHTALVPARAARHALNADSTVYQEDVNQDGILETVLVRPGDMAVLSPVGGQLLYWFDLEHGVELIGNENFFFYGESWTHDSRWRPALRGGVDVYAQHGGNFIYPEVHDWVFEIRRRGLADSLAIGGVDQGDLRNATMTATPLAAGVRFDRTLPSRTMSKEIRFGGPREIVVDYGIEDAADAVELLVENGLSPALTEVMDGGRGALAWWAGDIAETFTPDITGVINLRTGDRVEVTAPAAPSGREVVFGRLMAHTLTAPAPAPGEDVTFTLRLTRTRDAATPVTLASFAAVAEAGGVRVTWEPAAETDHAGYHLWRSLAARDRGHRLTEGIIPAGAPTRFLDETVEPGARCFYTLEAVSRTGHSEFFGPVMAEAAISGGGVLLHPAQPNPFAAGTKLRFSLPPRTAGPVPYALDLFDAAGRRVRTLSRGIWAGAAMEVSAAWDGRDDRGRPMPSGVYFFRLIAGEEMRTRRAVLLR